jgi:hypothetical protein
MVGDRVLLQQGQRHDAGGDVALVLHGLRELGDLLADGGQLRAARVGARGPDRVGDPQPAEHEPEHARHGE